MNVNYSSYAGCLRTATMGGRGRRVFADGHHAHGHDAHPASQWRGVRTFNHKEHRPRVRDRDHIDRRERGMETWDLTARRRSEAMAWRFAEGSGVAASPPSLGASTWRFAGESILAGDRAANHSPLIGSIRMYTAPYGYFSCVFSVNAPWAISRIGRFGGLQAAIIIGGEARGGPAMRGVAFARHEEAFGWSLGGQASDFGRVGSPKCLLMLPCACSCRLFFESFIGGACARPPWGLVSQRFSPEKGLGRGRGHQIRLLLTRLNTGIGEGNP
ncbi:MAG: hypothetical protein JWR26_197 [Pedosphaera sp.]|nr:hypothetical protein [Pedosphaera sp.]